MADKKLTRQELELKAKEYVLKAYDSFRNRSGLEDKWREEDAIFNLTRSSMKKSDNQAIAKTFSAELRRAVQTLADFVIDAIFPSNSDWYRIDGVDGDADVKSAKVYKKIGDVQDEKIMLRAKAIKAIYRWIKYGFMIVGVPYVYKDKYVIADEKAMGAFKKSLKDFLKGVQKLWKGDEVPKKEERAVYDNIDFQPKSPWHMFWNYLVPWEDQKIIIEKIDNVTASHLKAQKKKGVYNDNVDAVIEELKEKKTTGKVADETDYMQKYPHAVDITGLSDGFDDGIPRTSLLKADCYFDIDQDDYDELCIITLALTGEKDKHSTGDVIGLKLNDCELQELPILFCPWDEIEDSSLGMGAVQIGRRDLRVVNSFQNSTVDNVTEILDPTRVYDKDMLAEGQNLNSWPRKTIGVRGNPKDIIQFIRPPNIIAEAMAAINMFKENIRNGTRANVSLQGLAARYDTTATEYSKQGNAASRGIMCQIKNLEDRVLKMYKRFQYSYNLQYLEKGTLIAILGKTAAEATLKTENSKKEKSVREAIMGDYDFITLGVSQMENKVIKGQQLINILGLALKLPPGTVDIPLLFSKIWDVSGDGDSRIILPQITDPEMDPNDENVLISQGGTVHINPKDNDKAHLPLHLALQVIPEFAPMKMAHIKEHMISVQKKQMAVQAQAQGGVPQAPAFVPRPPLPGNNGLPVGVVKPPEGTM